MNEAHTRVDVRLATPGYFDTIGQPVVSGRTFRVDEPVPGGDDGAVGTVIVNQSLARQYWPGQNRSASS
jgi:hypothetical protein